MRPSPDPRGLVLVTGASGYVGGRLVGALLEAGYRVRCLARTPKKLDRAPWRSEVEVIEGDIEGDLSAAVDGVDVVYYLVHSIGEGADWSKRESAGAANLRDAATKAGVQRIVYLGGLGDASGDELSTHLESRHAVGRVLADGPVPVTELRAAVIIGAGSASFEMLRYLVEVLPVMVTPKWVDTRCQPIAIRDVIRYLVEVLETEDTAGRVLEIGGPEVLTYREMMAIYAEEAGLRKRLVIPVPVLTPRLSSHWVGLVTPLPRSLARPLVGSLVNEVIVNDPAIVELCPGERSTYRTAVSRALDRTRHHEVATRWTGAQSTTLAGTLPTDPDWAGGAVLMDERERFVDATPQAAHRVVSRIGGERGWYASDGLWAIRGLADKLVGGPGMRRGRRDPEELFVGDPVDFWRVEAIEPDTQLRLRAEMRLPGVASLEWRIEPAPDSEHGPRCRIRQTAVFVPRGLWGRVYWYSVAPFHHFVFPGLLDGIAADAEAEADHPDPGAGRTRQGRRSRVSRRRKGYVAPMSSNAVPSNAVPSNDAEIRASLEAERTQLLVQIDELTVGGEIDLDFDDDFADRGQVAGEQGENQVLAHTLQTQLTMVERAIGRIDDGTYGTCSVCGTTIGAERQAALPATDRCIEHA